MNCWKYDRSHVDKHSSQLLLLSNRLQTTYITYVLSNNYTVNLKYFLICTVSHMLCTYFGYFNNYHHNYHMNKCTRFLSQVQTLGPNNGYQTDK